MIDRLQNMCSASSQSDFAVITTDIIYFYDDKASLTSGSCKSVHYSTLFSGYSDLPDITHWKAVLTMSQSYVDVYTGITKKQVQQRNSEVVGISCIIVTLHGLRNDSSNF